ncbi:MAG: hypothetical protein O3A46_16525, partial [Candidatus Poribacteria bacterium]|nr:hypothetical protein [Candidatus Poribacteria bacterium]
AAFEPILEDDSGVCTEAQWRELLAKIAPYETWLNAKPNSVFGSLGVETLRAHLDGTSDGTVRSLIEQDTAIAAELRQLQALEKLVLYHQWLFEFANNFASFPRLFEPNERALFEWGTLVLAGWEFHFSVAVENRAKHADLAKNSRMYLLYLQLSGSKPEDSREIVVPVTRGGSRQFYVGRRGVFFTTSGRELDAQIVQIVENPISLCETMKEPFRRLRDLVTKRLDQVTTSAYKEADATFTQATAKLETSIQSGMRDAQASAMETTEALSAPPPVSPTPAPIAPTLPDSKGNTTNSRDMLIGVGLLAAGLGTAFKFLTDTVIKLSDPRTLMVVGITFSVITTTLILLVFLNAWLQLRKRDLAVLLQACGWAINGRMLMSRRVAKAFSEPTRLPPEAKRRRKERRIKGSRDPRSAHGFDDSV